MTNKVLLDIGLTERKPHSLGDTVSTKAVLPGDCPRGLELKYITSPQAVIKFQETSWEEAPRQDIPQCSWEMTFNNLKYIPSMLVKHNLSEETSLQLSVLLCKHWPC